MSQFLNLTLRDVPLFPNQSFDLSRKGISLILGRNFDSSKSATNGAGKSYFFGQIAELMLDEPTIGIKKDRVRKGTVELSFMRGEDTYTVARTFSPREVVTINKNGKDLDYRELSAAKERLAKLLPYSDAEIKSLLHLDARLAHPLIRGTGSQRKDFFQRFFKLYGSSFMRKLIKKEMDELKEASGSLSEVKAQLESLLKGDATSPADLRARLDKLQSKQTALQETSRKYSRIVRVQESFVEAKPLLAILKELGLREPEDAKSYEDKLRRREANMQEAVAVWELYLSNKKKAARTNAARQELLATLPDGLDPSSEEAAAVRTGSRLQELRDEIRDKREAVESLQEQMDKTSRLKSRRAQLEDALERRKALKKAKDTCPTCGGEYDNKHAAKELADVTDQISSLEEDIAKLEEIKEAVPPKLEKVSTALKSLTKERDGLVQVKEALEALDALPNVKVEEPDLDGEAAQAKLEAIEKTMDSIRGWREAFADRDAFRALSEDERAILTGEDPTDQLVELTDKIGALKVAVEAAQERVDEIAKLTARKDKYEELLGEQDVLELLTQAFSPRNGVESLQIRAVCGRLEQEVNKYAKLLFPENFEFQFDLDKDFSILCHRRYGKRVETSDVRKLSGAEASLFALILLIALLVFVPAKDRPSILILDEPTATMGPDMIDAFVKFLPTLNTVIPHIIVITPRPQVPYPNAKIYTVVKHKGRSQIVEGEVKTPPPPPKRAPKPVKEAA